MNLTRFYPTKIKKISDTTKILSFLLVAFLVGTLSLTVIVLENKTQTKQFAANQGDSCGDAANGQKGQCKPGCGTGETQGAPGGVCSPNLVCCLPFAQTHRGCSNNMCVDLAGPGTDNCSQCCQTKGGTLPGCNNNSSSPGGNPSSSGNSAGPNRNSCAGGKPPNSDQSECWAAGSGCAAQLPNAQGHIINFHLDANCSPTCADSGKPCGTQPNATDLTCKDALGNGTCRQGSCNGTEKTGTSSQDGGKCNTLYAGKGLCCLPPTANPQKGFTCDHNNDPSSLNNGFTNGATGQTGHCATNEMCQDSPNGSTCITKTCSPPSGGNGHCELAGNTCPGGKEDINACGSQNGLALGGGVIGGTKNLCCSGPAVSHPVSVASIALPVYAPPIGNKTGENANPVDKQKTGIITGYSNTNNTKAFSGTGALTYDPKSGYFINTNLNLGNITPGNYQLSLHIDGYLDTQLTQLRGSKVFKIGPGSKLLPDPATVMPGDIAPGSHGDNFIDIIDYNKLITCFNQNTTATCKTEDLNDDGKIDQTDLDLLLSHFGSLGFSFETPGFSCEVDPSCNSGQNSLQMCTLICKRDATTN